MKTILKNPLWFTVITTLFLVIITLASSCDKSESPPATCNFDKPLTDLPWLKEIIDEFEKEKERLGYNRHARIYQCSYNEGIGFLVEMCVGCSNAAYSFRDCEGMFLCGGGPLGEAICSQLNIDFENKVLIWEVEKSTEYYIYENFNISACGVNNPLQNIEWLKEYCSNIKEKQDIFDCHIGLYKIIDKDEYIFRISNNGIAFLLNCNSDPVFEEETLNSSVHSKLSPPSPWLSDKEYIGVLFHFIKL